MAGLKVRTRGSGMGRSSCLSAMSTVGAVDGMEAASCSRLAGRGSSAFLREEEARTVTLARLPRRENATSAMA